MVVNIWKWLQQCSRADILGTRRIVFGQKLSDFQWDCDAQKHLIGFICGVSSATPRNTPTKWKTVLRPKHQDFKINQIADNLPKIRHWDIRLGDFSEAPDREATWFIDPPYQIAGKTYKHGSRDIDYPALGDWCKSRKGQVMVCESSGAEWLDFRDLVLAKGGAKKSYKERIWTNS